METQKDTQEAMDELFFDNKKELEDLFGPMISVYTRAQAIEDGLLGDVSEMAKEAGFKFPTAITSALHETLADIKKTSHEDYNGRLWDVLNVLKFSIRKSQGGPWLQFKVKIAGRYVELMSNCGPGDNGEPVITIGYASDF